MRPATPSHHPRLVCALTVVGVVVLSVGLRLAPMGKGLIPDEAFSRVIAAQPLGDIPASVRRWDAHPPLYYMLLSAGSSSDASDAGLRLPSLVLGLLQLLVMWALGRSMGSPRLALAFVGLGAVNVLLCSQSALARNYTLHTLLMTIAWLVLVRALRTGGVLWWSLLTALYAASLYTFYYAAHAIAALSVFLWLARPGRRRVLAYGGVLVATALLFLPWLPAFQEQLARVQLRTGAGWSAVTWTPEWILRKLLARHALSIAPWGAPVAVAALAALGFVHRVRPAWFASSAPEPAQRDEQRWLRPTVGAGLAFFAAIVVAGLAGSFVHVRFAAFLAVIWIVLAGLLIDRLPRRIGLAVLIALVAGGAASTLWRQARAKPSGAEAATQRIVTGARANDVTLCINPDGSLLYDRYRRGRGPSPTVVRSTARRASPPWQPRVLRLDRPETFFDTIPAGADVWLFVLAPTLVAPDALERLEGLLGSGGFQERGKAAHGRIIVRHFAR